MNTEVITSRDNRRLVEARKVRDGKAEGKIFIEGRRLVEEALRSKLKIGSVFVADDFGGETLPFSGMRVYEVRRELFKSIADTDNSQGLIVIAERPASGPDRLACDSPVPVVLYLHEISNPSNLGAVIRAAEAAGVRGVIVSNNSADVFSAKAVRAAMGSSFRVPVWDNASLNDAFRWAKENQLVTTAAVVSAAASYADADWTRPRMVIMGSEAVGLSNELLDRVDETIKIPMAHDVESLNLAVATGIILFEAKRQIER